MGKLEVYCPVCGELFQSEEEMLEHYDKSHDNKDPEEKAVLPSKILISDSMSDQEIKDMILQDMLNLSMHETGTAWMRLGTLLSLNPTEQMLGAGLKAIIDQNKIMIRQNELIIRALSKSKEKSQETNHKEPATS
jgi:hypothetical protein